MYKGGEYALEAGKDAEIAFIEMLYILIEETK
jgi:hypothetical protein